MSLKIAIASHKRPHDITTAKLVRDFDYTVMVDNQTILQDYVKAGRVPTERLAVTGSVGLPAARNYALQTIAKPGDWVLFLDDNIKHFSRVDDAHYQEPELDTKNKASEDWNKIYGQNLTFNELVPFLEETIKVAEGIGANHIGFPTTSNPYFRPRKYRTCGFAVGKFMLTKATGHLFDPYYITCEDYEYSASQMLKYGQILLNNYLCAHKTHEMPGGVGTYEQRLPAKIVRLKALLNKYPNVYRYNERAGRHPESEIRMRFNAPDKLIPAKSVLEWREWMKTNGHCDSEYNAQWTVEAPVVEDVKAS